MDISSAELLEVSTVALSADVNSKVLLRALSARMSGRSTAADRAVIARVESQMPRRSATSYSLPIEAAVLSAQPLPGNERKGATAGYCTSFGSTRRFETTGTGA